MSYHTTNKPTDDIPYGYCHCGCGQKTRVPTKNVTKDKQIKGVPLRFIPGHQFGKRTLHEAFWQYGAIHTDGSCWEWQGPTRMGYGCFRYRDEPKSAHRVSYELHKGEIPDGMLVCHKCDNPICVNPAHLFLGTQSDNVKDKTQKNRQAKGEEHGQAKLKDADVRRIRRLYQSGVTQTAIAREYGMSNANISDIVRRNIWKHVK